MVNDVSREAPGSPLRARFLHGARDLIERMTGLLPTALAKRRRQRALASLSLMIGAVALARALDDDELSEEVLAAARNVLSTGKVG
jgi:TetR/AcrR family transcriptional repressor of nem operon